MPESTNVVVLFSGGLDSLLCALLAERNEGGLTALSIDYGQSDAELYAAARLCTKYKWRQVRAKVTPFPGSLDPSGANLIRGRNAMLLSLAVATLPEEAGRIYIGSNADDYRDYPDCRGEFFAAFQSMCAAQGLRIIIKHPLLNLTKKEIVSQLRKRGAPLDETVSCYAGSPACGVCNACKLREAALA